MTVNGWRYAAAERPDALLDQLAALELEEARHKRLLLLAGTAAMALHALLLVLAPRPTGRPAPIVLDLRAFELAATPDFVEPPKVEAPPVERPAQLDSIPVPDSTPDGLEPIREAAFDATPPLDVPIDDSLGFVAAPPAPPASVEPAVHRVGGKVLAPVRRHDPAPAYPRAALAIRREATVVLEAIIDAGGRVTSLRPLTRHGLGFEESAIRTVADWRFDPGTLEGRPVAVLYQLTIRFEIAN